MNRDGLRVSVSPKPAVVSTRGDKYFESTPAQYLPLIWAHKKEPHQENPVLVVQTLKGRKATAITALSHNAEALPPLL